MRARTWEKGGPSRDGWTRLVRNTTYRPAAGSIQSDVPVKPVCPIARGDIRVPQEDVGSMVSQPSARELPGTVLRVTNRASVSGVPSRVTRANVLRTSRANAP